MIKVAAQLRQCLVQHLRAGKLLPCWRHSMLQGNDDAPGYLKHITTALGPGIVKGRQDVDKARHSTARMTGEVGASEEWLLIMIQEHRHRPTATAGQGECGLHVDSIDVGPFLAIDLHRYEALVDELGNLQVLE